MGELIAWALAHLNYWTITIFMIVESSFIPFPSEVIVPPAAYLAANGELNIVLVVLCATFGASIGALLNYYLAYFLGRPIVYAFARSKLGRMCLLSPAKVEYAEAYFNKNGAVSTLVGRLIPAVRQLISVPAGLAKMKLNAFIFYTCVGAAAWNIVLAALGYGLARVPGIETPEQLVAKVTVNSHIIGYSIAAIVFILLTIYIVRSWLKKKRSNEAEKTE